MRTILKWAGSKSRIIETLKQHLPTGDRLVEPFAGSCAVMMNTEYSSYLVSDINKDIINLYQVIASDSVSFIPVAKLLFIVGNTAEQYYKLRADFNLGITDKVCRAAVFLYLNRHCFNGLCRYNQSGGFNVPYGKYKTPYFPDAEIRAFALKAKHATFVCCSFEEALHMVVPGDVVYCDPPYLSGTKEKNFTNYHAAGFNDADQRRLASLLKRLSERSYPVIASNADVPDARFIYSAFNITELNAPRSVGASAGCAKSAPEIIAKITPKKPRYLPPDPAVDSLLMAGFPMREEIEEVE